MKQMITQILGNKLINAAVRVPIKTFLSPLSNQWVKYFLIRIPVVAKFRVRLPDGNSLVIASGRGPDPVGRRLFWWGFDAHEPETSSVFYKLAQESNTIFDVGANIGYFSLLASVANRKSRIVAFEPLPEFFKCLKGNIDVNLASNVIALSAAVTNYDGKIILFVNEQESSIIEGFRSPKAEMEVAAVTLDSYVKEAQIDKVDLIKIDVETGEPRVFEGMQYILKRDEPRIICEVLCKETEVFFNSFLSDYAYRFYWITDDGLVRKDIIVYDEKYRYRNYLFTKDNVNGFI